MEFDSGRIIGLANTFFVALRKFIFTMKTEKLSHNNVLLSSYLTADNAHRV